MISKSIILAALAVAAACCQAAEWDCDPIAWRQEGGRFEAVGSGFALAPCGKGASVAVSARITPVSTESPEYASMGLSVFDDLDHHWKLSILKTPDAKGARHVFEFKRQDGGDWTDGDGLATVVNRRTGGWEWGDALDLALSLTPTGLVGVVSDAATGRELFRREYAVAPNGKGSGLGRPALFASSDMRGHAENVLFSVADEVPDCWRKFPEYRPVGPETGVRGTATGFFHMENIGGIDWAIDPLGRGVVLAGTDWCNPRGSFDQSLGYRPYERFVREHYASLDDWAVETASRLSAWGFTFLPCGGDDRLLYRTLAHANAADRLYFSHRLCLGTADPDWRIAEYRRSPCTALPNVFHPDFQAACDWWARQRCAPCRDDPWLVGYFIDNELAWWGEVSANKAGGVFDAVMKKPASHPARMALDEFLAGRAPTAELKVGFLRLVAERYFAATTSAIRKADPNHMVLGCRFAGGPNGVHQSVMEVAGKYCDIVSFNHYPWADLDLDVVFDSKANREPVVDLYRRAHAAAGKPLLLTEWSFPALDAARPCTHGAGQRFRTQAERVVASELYARTILSLPFFAGYSYFRWIDQPAAGISRYFPENTNYGLVSLEGVPYSELTGMFARVQGDAARWRLVPPTEWNAGAGTATGDAQPSERDRYFAEASARIVTPRQREFGPVGVRRDTGGSWEVSNGLVRISGRVGGKCMADEIAYGDSPPIGRWGALLEGMADGMPYWVDITRVTDVSLSRDETTGIVSATIRAEGGGGAAVAGGDAPESLRFAFTHRLSLAPGDADILAEILSLENLGGEPIAVRSLFMRPFAVEKAPREVDTVPNLWKGPTEDYWLLSDGSRWGIASADEGVLKATLWINKEGSSQHPDVRCMVDAPFILAPGDKYTPEKPIGARIVLKKETLKHSDL